MNFCSRFGWIGEKIGMTTMLIDKKSVGVTLVKIMTQNILSKVDLDDYSILKVGIESGKLKTKPQIEEMKKLNKPLCKIVKEFRVSKEESDSVNVSYAIDLIESEKFVDVTAENIGKGFAGGMKRWNFDGQPASHGASLSHRAIGSTGTRDKNWKGKKMPGRLGGETVTVQNLKVCYVDKELSVVALHGAVPGKSGSVVFVRKAIKKQGVKK